MVPGVSGWGRTTHVMGVEVDTVAGYVKKKMGEGVRGLKWANRLYM